MKFKRLPSIKLPRYFTILLLVLSFFTIGSGTVLSTTLPYRAPTEWVARQHVQQDAAAVITEKTRYPIPGSDEVYHSKFKEFKSVLIFLQLSPQLHSAHLE